LLTALINPQLKSETMLVLFGASAFCSLYGGFWIGLIAIIVSIFGHDFWFQYPKGHFEIGSISDGIELGLFFVMNVIVNSFGSQLRKLRIHSQEMTVQMEQTLALISHDIRSPITAARLMAQFASRPETSTESRLTMLSKIIKSLDRIDQMIVVILDSSKIHAGKKLSVSLEVCDLAEILKEAIAEIALVHGDRFIVSAKHPIIGNWDKSGMRRVVENLATNAIKYGDFSAPILIDLYQSPDKVTLAVHNEGLPISIQQQAKLFQPFHRTNSAEKSGKLGWGIGLTLVKGMAEAHGGTVRVESSPGTGTTFILELWILK
jgi:signal transduction histidine kinase